MELTVTKQVLSRPVGYRNLYNRFGENTKFTCREIEILQVLSRGLQYKEIADILGLSLNTVKNHLKKIFRKLRVQNRTEATVIYLHSERN
jgi:DNA-binding NarL/FixJ family response regulator